MDMTNSFKEQVRASMHELVRQRGPGKSICPSEVARAVAEEWRQWMPLVREVAAEEMRAARLLVTQKGKPVAPETARGPIRLALYTSST